MKPKSPLNLLRSTFVQVLAAILVAAFIISIGLSMSSRYSTWSRQKDLKFTELDAVIRLIHQKADTPATVTYGIDRIHDEEREMVAILDVKPYFPLTPTERRLREMCVNHLLGKQP
jgi:hypothetical protein